MIRLNVLLRKRRYLWLWWVSFFFLAGRGLNRVGGLEGRSRSQPHRPMFHVTRVPGFALKRETGTGQLSNTEATGMYV